MLDWMGLALRILALCNGLICLYLAIFLYETEQGKVQNVLEDLWVRVEDLKLAALSRQAAFVRVVAGATAAAYQRLFGKRLISWQAWAVSACYSLASLCLLVGYLVHRHDILIAKVIHEARPNVIVANTLYRAEYGDYIEASLFTAGIGLLVLGSFPLIMRRAPGRNVWLALVASSVVVSACVLFWMEYSGWIKYYNDAASQTRAGHTSLLWENLLFTPTPDILSRRDFVLTMLVAFWTGIVIGITSDMIFIIVTRRTLQWASELDNFIGMVILIGSNGLLATAFSLGPAIVTYQASVALATQRRPRGYIVAPWSIDLLAEGMRQAGYIASLSNAMTAVVALAVLGLASIALLHRLLWPLLERPVYSLQRLGIGRRSKLVGMCGIALMGAATNLPSWLGSLIGHLL